MKELLDPITLEPVSQPRVANAVGGVKDDSGKLDWNLILRDMPDALEAACKVLHWAAYQKPNPYPPGNWAKVEDSRYENALMRHLMAVKKGEMLDKESGLHHYAHALSNLLILLQKEIDNG